MALKEAKKKEKAAAKSSGDSSVEMMRQFRKAIKDYQDGELKFYMNPENCRQFYFRFTHKTDPNDKTGDLDPLDGGEYLFEVTATSQFPFDPPTFQALTPNGVYKEGVLPCLVGGIHHSESFIKALGMGGFARTMIINGLICPEELGSGLNLLLMSKSDRVSLAKKSRAYNEKNHPELTKIFDDIDSAYNAAH